MPQNDAVSKALSSAKSTLSHANAAFPSPKAAPAPTTAQKVTAPAKAPTTMDELNAKTANVNQYIKSLPKMHTGGPVMADGAYQLKAGEHVLTAAETKKAHKHALMAVGMKSLAKASPMTAGQPKVVDAAHKMPQKKITSGVTVRPEKNQSAKIAVKK